MNVWVDPRDTKLVIKTPARVTLESIQAIASVHRVDVDAILGKDRSRKAFNARVDVCKYFVARGWSSVRIGKYLNKDHSTVLHMIRKAGITSESIKDDEDEF